MDLVRMVINQFKGFHMTDSYDFDRCTIDDSDKEGMTLDNWRPQTKKRAIIPSEWRRNQIGNNFDQQPGLDELKKIEMFLKRKTSDAEIMNAFGISAEMLIAIKKGKYCPIGGISMDNLSKIYAEFKHIHKSIEKLQRGIDYLSEVLFIEKDDLKKYKDYCKNEKVGDEKKGKEKKQKERF
jgi:DNA-binding Xre family transcriptional regulator